MFLLTSTSDVLVSQMSFAPLRQFFWDRVEELSFLHQTRDKQWFQITHKHFFQKLREGEG